MSTCAHCGGDLPESAVFCPSCGRRTDAEPRDVPIDVQHAEPRYFGLGPPVFVFLVSVALVVGGIVMLFTGLFAIGVLAIVIGVALLPSFLAAARRWPDTSLARFSVSTADRVRDEAGVAVESISTWTGAGREVARLRKEQFALRRERDARIRELGQSVYADDGRADELKASARELDERIEANDRELQKTIASARRRTRKSRAAVVSTEVFQPGEVAVEPELEVEASERVEHGTPPGDTAVGEGAVPDAPDPEAPPTQVDDRA